MADTYQNMVDNLQTLIDRDDASEQIAATSGNLVNILNQAYDKAERRLYRDDVSKTPPFEKSITYENVPIGTASLAIPNDYFESRYGYTVSQDRRVILEKVSAEEILEIDPLSQVGIPRRFAYGSNEWLIDKPSQVNNITMIYYGALDPIASITSADTPHFVVNRADDLLLYWAAVECGLYFQSIDQTYLTAWEGKAKDIRDSMLAQDARQRKSGSRPRWGKAYTVPSAFSSGAGR